MSFETFINSIFNCLNNFLNGFTKMFNIMIQNNFVKLIIYIALFIFAIELLFHIIDFIHNIFSMKKEAAKNKEKSKTDIE